MCRAESPANGMASTLFELARNPAVQARMVQEIDRVGLKTAPTYEDLPKLSYVEAVFQACSLSSVLPFLSATVLGKGWPSTRGKKAEYWRQHSSIHPCIQLKDAQYLQACGNSRQTLLFESQDTAVNEAPVGSCKDFSH